ncbi:MAG: alpha/beta fold hydrolase [Myxococcota bacterium]
MPTASAQTVSIPARDGYELAGSWWGPDDPARVVMINAATAVPRRFYRHFAASLVDEGYGVLTYDYRGIGDSAPASLRGFRARMRDWGMLDMAGALDWVRSRHRGAGISMVGHSVGGQLAGLLDNAEEVDGIATFSAQSGHWRLQGGSQKAMVALHMHLTFPAMARAVGYIPWSNFGGGEDLPAGVAREWARWCRDPRYLFGDPTLPLHRYADFDAPVLAYSFDDDDWGTARSVDTLMREYPRVRRRHVAPAEAGLRSIGHFGFFRPDAAGLWPDVIAWLGAPTA